MRATEIARVELANQSRVMFRCHVVYFFVVCEDNTISGGEFMALCDDVKQDVAVVGCFRFT